MAVITVAGKVECSISGHAVSYGLLYLQEFKIPSLRRSRSFSNTLVMLDQRATEELLWWRDQLRT